MRRAAICLAVAALSVGVEGTAGGVSAQKSVKVTVRVPSIVEIVGLGEAIEFGEGDLTFDQESMKVVGTKALSFSVVTNMGGGVVVSAVLARAPEKNGKPLTGLKVVSPVKQSVGRGTTPATLVVQASIGAEQSPGSYAGGIITITAVGCGESGVSFAGRSAAIPISARTSARPSSFAQK